MQYGPLPANDASFRALCLLLGRHPIYSKMPMSRALDLHVMVQEGKNFCAVEGGTLKGALLWREVPAAAAAESIRAKTFPKPQDVVPKGDAVALLGWIAPSKTELRPMWDAFMATQPGRVVIYERHFPGKPSRFGWFDRRHVENGPDI